MDDYDVISYELDAEDHLVDWNDAFERFGLENGLGAEIGVGARMTDWIEGSGNQGLHRWLLWLARDRPPGIRYRYRCDSPGVYRLLEMTVSQTRERGLQLSSHAIEVRQLQGDDLGMPPKLPFCIWCDRTVSAGDWVALEDEVLELDAGDPRLDRGIDFGICPSCASRAIAETMHTEDLDRPS